MIAVAAANIRSFISAMAFLYAFEISRARCAAGLLPVAEKGIGINYAFQIEG